MKTIKLLNDQLPTTEAKETLLKMVDSTINHYKLQNLKNQVQQEKADPEAMTKVKELQELRAQFIDLIKDTNNNEYALQVESTVKLVRKEQASVAARQNLN